MYTRTPFLGTPTHDRNQAFPDIKALSITIAQDPYGFYHSTERHREDTYTKDTVPRYAACCNPRCQQGGIDLQKLINFSGTGEYKYHCDGHEGSPKGRRPGASCDNVFSVKITVEKLAKEAT